MAKITLLFHTHWDREWYYSLDTFNMRLLKVMDRFIELIEDGAIASFVFDGQVKPLQDYLSLVDDAQKARVLTLIKENKIIIGPWYVLSDEFLVQGESLIRNLEIGIEKAWSYGACQRVGYLPDTFGHISQMPQILKQFDIDNAVLWRGVDSKDMFFTWLGADETPLFTVFLKEGYYQPIIDQEKPEQLLEAWLIKHTLQPGVQSFLLTNGGDHLMPSRIDLKKRLKALEKATGHTFEVSNYEDYINAHRSVKSSTTFRGELRDNQNAYVLPNVLSTRVPIKIYNQWLENRLTAHLEPLIALSYLDESYPYKRYLNQAWETLLENHPHDSICGCSIDAVHREMITRFRKIEDQCASMEKDALVHMGLFEETKNFSVAETKIFDDTSRFTVYNPTPYTQSCFTNVKLSIHKDSPLIDQFVVADETTTYETTIREKSKIKSFESPLDAMPAFREGYDYDVVFKVNDIPGYGMKTYRLKEGQPTMMKTTSEKTIENNYLSVQVNIDGTLDVYDKVHQKMYRNTHQVYASLDAGDEYNYAKPQTDQVQTATLKKHSVFKSSTCEILECSFALELPKGLNKTRKKASDETITNRIELSIQLFKDNPNILCDMRYENQAKDHRTRLRFPSEHVFTHYSDTAFDLVERRVRAEIFVADKGKEVPAVVDPTLSMVYTDQGFRFNHIGLQEYQVINDNDKSYIDVTLLRSVGYLSRDDLTSRGGGAGPAFETPDAQLIGTHRYRYQFSFNQSLSLASSTFFKNPLIAYKGHPKKLSYLIDIDNKDVIVSGLRKKADGLELRVYNPYPKSVDFELKSSRAIKSMKTVDMIGKELHVASQNQLKPKEIRTFQVTFEKPKVLKTDVLIVGGSIGGVLAASVLAAAKRTVIMTEEAAWIGGQLTNQGVPLDEHPFIESFGCTKRYRAFRNTIRSYYQKTYGLKGDVQTLNPGNAWVTRLAFEPKVAHQYFQDVLKPYASLKTLCQHIPLTSDSSEKAVRHVVIKNLKTGELITVKARYYIDATDTGALLPITHTPYRVGAECKAETEEPNAPLVADAEDMQPVTHVAALKWDEHACKPIEKPASYDTFRSMKTPYDDYPILSEYGPDSTTKKARKFNIMVGSMPLWRYRRIYDPKTLNTPDKPERTLLNWPQNDYFMGNIFDCENAEKHKTKAKELTMALIYYLQTEVPNHKRGHGYPQIQIDTETLGTSDGLAMAPYIRESRRIRALKTIREQDVSAKTNQTLPRVEDSVGVGSYHIDLHITTKSHTFFYDNTWPFEIPLKALVPIKKTNLLPACKNIGTTHLTNGCFRLHPVEWNIGESVGHLVDYLIEHHLDSHTFVQSRNHIDAYKKRLDEAGIERHWPEDKVHVI